MILSPELKVTTFARHLLNREHRRKRGRRGIVAVLMLTSMVDMFSLLVIFLLQSFSNSPEVMALSNGLTLPSAVSAAAAIDAPVLTVSQDQVLLDQKLIGPVSAVVERPALLAESLSTMKKIWQQAHGAESFKGDIHLQADRKLSSSLISRLINVLNSQGYASVHLAVVSGGPL
jgi:biopolymer transport protein ExbD